MADTTGTPEGLIERLRNPPLPDRLHTVSLHNEAADWIERLAAEQSAPKSMPAEVREALTNAKLAFEFWEREVIHAGKGLGWADEPRRRGWEEIRRIERALSTPPAPAPKGKCSTCGATDPRENVLCSNGFHAPAPGPNVVGEGLERRAREIVAETATALGYIDEDVQNFLVSELDGDDLLSVLAAERALALAAPNPPPDSAGAHAAGFIAGRDAAAKIALGDYTPGYGPHRDDMEALAAIQRRNIADRIRALEPPAPPVGASDGEPSGKPASGDVTRLVERLESVARLRHLFDHQRKAIYEAIAALQAASRTVAGEDGE